MRILISSCLVAFLWAAVALNPAAAADPWTISNVDTAPGTVSFSVSGAPGAAVPVEGSVAVTADGRTLKSSVDPNLPSAQAKSGRRVAYLVVDVSGSMADAGIQAARKAAADYAHAIPDDVELGLITFADTVKVVVPATTDHAKALAALNAVKPAGDTALYDAVVSAVAASMKITGADERRLLILSDGDDTSSSVSLDRAVDALSAKPVQADVVAFRLPGERAVLDRLSAASHGRTLAAENAEKLADAFRAVAADFAPRLRVQAEVPDTLAGKSSTLVVSGVADGEGWESQALVTFAPLKAARAQTTSVAGAFTSSVWLVPLLLFIFVALFVTMVGLLEIPGRARVRAVTASRVAEAGRYRAGAAALQSRPGAEGRSVAASPSAISERALELMDRRLRSTGSRQNVVTDLEGAGLRMRPEEWAIVQLSAVIVAAALLAVVGGTILLVPVGGLLGWAACRLFLRWRKSKRQAQFLEQIPDTLQLITGSLRAGFSMPQALGTVVREGTEPTAGELSRALTETRLGATLEDALDDVASRMNCTDLAWVVIAVRIAREVGGNLAEVMETTVATMRERAELRGTVRVLSAEGRLSAWILSALPFVVGGFILVSRPGYFDPMIGSLVGWAMFASGALLLAVGIFWLSRLVRIEV